jgi:hypothetical protein
MCSTFTCKTGDEIRNTVLKSFKVKTINELVVTSNKLTNNSLVVVTSRIGPNAAAGLFTALKRSWVHAPVLLNFGRCFNFFLLGSSVQTRQKSVNIARYPTDLRLVGTWSLALQGGNEKSRTRHRISPDWNGPALERSVNGCRNLAVLKNPLFFCGLECPWSLGGRGVEKEFLALLPLIDSSLFTSANDQLGLAYPHLFFSMNSLRKLANEMSEFFFRFKVIRLKHNRRMFRCCVNVWFSWRNSLSSL